MCEICLRRPENVCGSQYDATDYKPMEDSGPHLVLLGERRPKIFIIENIVREYVYPSMIQNQNVS